MFDWQGLLILTGIGAVFAILGYFLGLNYWISAGNSIEEGVTKPFMIKVWTGIGLIAPVMHLLYQFHVFR
jgi:hypothetical protein